MSYFRSYFEKNNTLIENNELNVSQNPVGEVSYGTPEHSVSRIILKIDLNDLRNRLESEGIIFSKITSHRLKLVNTIAERPDLIGGQSYLDTIDRATTFTLEFFEITENWTEGGGYTFSYNKVTPVGIATGVTNWYQRGVNQSWTVPGAYVSGSSEIIGTQTFQKGNEDIDIDITNYINDIIYGGATHYGIGIKFSDEIEAMVTTNRKAVAFHLKNTHTFYEPYLETIIDDSITDDRNFFYMDKDNDLYLYSSRGDVTVNGISIYDHNDQLIEELDSSVVERVRKGVYKFTYFVNSSQYPDSVIFRDVWNITQNSKNKNISQDFYLLNPDIFYNFDLSNRINFDNYHFSYFGIKSGEYIKRGDLRRIELEIKQLYKSQASNIPLDIQYRLFIKQGADNHVDIIPFTSIDRTKIGYEFTLDTSWLVPQDYYLELKLSNEKIHTIKAPIKFTIISSEAFTKS